MPKNFPRRVAGMKDAAIADVAWYALVNDSSGLRILQCMHEHTLTASFMTLTAGLHELKEMVAESGVQWETLVNLEAFPVSFESKMKDELERQTRKSRGPQEFGLVRTTEVIHSPSAEITALNLDHPNEALLAPIYCLPAETLTRIFGFAMPTRVLWRRESAPLNLSHVCSMWRNVALTSSALWTALCIDVFCHSRPHVLPELLSSWSARSANMRPLSLTLANHISCGKFAEGLTRPIIPFISRFTRLCFENVTFESLVPIFGLTRGSLPILEVLLLDVGGTGFDNPAAPITVFGDTPRLHIAVLKISSPIIADESRFVFPWWQLTTLSLGGGIALHTFSKIIVQCLHLRYGSFVLSSQEDLQLPEPSIPPDVVTFETLSVLMIKLSKFWDPSGLNDVLSMFDLPAIRTLTLESMHKSCAFPAASIHRNTGADLSSMYTLEFHSHLDTEDELFVLLSACPSLEILSLRADTTTSAKSLLSRLRKGAIAPHYELPLPCLTSFSLRMVVTAEMQTVAEELFQLVLAWVERTGSPCPYNSSMLEVVSIGVYDPQDREDTIEFVHAAFHYLRRSFESLECTGADGMVKCPVLLDTQVLREWY